MGGSNTGGNGDDSIGGDEDDNGGGGDRRQRRRGHRQQSTKSREEKMATVTATAAVTATATVTMTVTTMTMTMRMMARSSVGHRRHKGAIVMLWSNRCDKVFKVEFLRRILRIFCSRHFVKTPPDHGVRRSVAPMAHFYKVSCPDTLGASSLGANE